MNDPKSLISVIGLLQVILMACLPTGGMQATNPDTLWVPAQNCFQYGDPATFTLRKLPGSTNLLLSSDLGFDWILDADMRIVASSPIFQIPHKNRPSFQIKVTAVLDSLWLMGWENERILSIVPGLGDADPCARTPRIAARDDAWWGPRHGVGLAAQSILPLVRKSANEWWLYSPARLDYGPDSKLEDGKAPAFRVFQVTRVRSGWKMKPLELEIAGYPVTKSALDRRNYFGSTCLVQEEGDFWWSDCKLPTIYRLDAMGTRTDSLSLGVAEVDPDATFAYDVSKSDRWNHGEMQKTTSYYGPIQVGPRYITRLLWSAANAEWQVLAYDREQGVQHRFSLPKDAGAGGHWVDRFLLPGVRIGDRIAFPYHAIDKLVAESTRAVD